MVKKTYSSRIRQAILRCRAMARHICQQVGSKRPAEDVFSEIYRKNHWGGEPGEFFSGPGSVDRAAVEPYVQLVGRLAASRGFAGTVFVDLGCGDFRVGEQLRPLASEFVGVDVVKALVEHLQTRFGDEKTRFQHLDITRDELPAGDVCFLRQVLQHLSNHEISRVLKKLQQYRWALITEHHPNDDPRNRSNLDIVHGSTTRTWRRSGVFITEPPFNLPKSQVELVLEAFPQDSDAGLEPGVFRTYLHQPHP